MFSRENNSALGLEMCTVLAKCSELTERRNTLKPDDLYVMQANACDEMTHGGRLTLEARDFANVFSCHSGLWFALTGLADARSKTHALQTLRRLSVSQQ